MVCAKDNFSYKGQIVSSFLDQVELKEDAFLDAFVDAQILERMGGLPIPEEELEAAQFEIEMERQKQVKVLEGEPEEAKQEEKVRTRLWDLIAKNTKKYVEYELTYNDNIFGTETSKSDIINEIKTGFETEIIGVKHHLGLDTSLTQHIYNKHPDENHSDIDIQLEGHRNPGQGAYTFYISDRFQTDYFSTSRMFGLSDTAGIPSWHNDLFLSAGREMNRLSYDTGFLFKVNRYEAEYARQNDSNEYRYNLSTYFRIAPKTRLFLEYDRGFNRYVYSIGASGNSIYQNAFFGAHSLLTGKLSGVLKFGLREHDYKSAEDYKEAIFEGNLTHNLTPRTSFNLQFERTTHDTADLDENYYVENRYVLSGSHQFAFDPRLQADFSLGYRFLDYSKMSGTTREDNLYNLIFGLAYSFQDWLALQLTYEYDARRSNTEYDYDNSIFSIRAVTTF